MWTWRTESGQDARELTPRADCWLRALYEEIQTSSAPLMLVQVKCKCLKVDLKERDEECSEENERKDHIILSSK